MLKEYLKSSLRNLIKNKVSTAINIIGLALGVGSSLILFVIINFELSFDTHHNNYDRTYRITSISHSPTGDEFDPGAYYPTGIVLREAAPMLDHVAMVKHHDQETISFEENGEKKLFQEDHVGFAEQSYFSVFDVEWISGNPDEALTTLHSVVLTESVARKYFGDAEALNRTINLGSEFEAIITGVIADPPPNSDFPFTLIFDYKSLDGYDQFYSEDGWNVASSEVHCYVVLAENATIDQVDDHLLRISEEKLRSQGKDHEYYAQPLATVHFDTRFSNFNDRTASKQMLAMLGLIGFILVLTACINFVNLATAQSVKRAKETGIRKVMGSTRMQLVTKYLVETSVVTLLAILISLGLAELTINSVREFINLESTISLVTDVSVYIYLAIVLVFVSIAAGLYPSMVISRYQPVQSLKKKISTESGGIFTFRRGLVLTQFVIAQLLIIGTIVITHQIRLFTNTPLGFDKEEVVLLPLFSQDEGKMEVFRNELVKHEQIVEVSYAVGGPLSGNNFDSSFRLQADAEDRHRVNVKAVDENYLEMYDLELLAGRSIRNDTSFTVVVNEQLLTVLGIEEPQDALGEQIFIFGDMREIVGVVKDFHVSSLHQDIPSTLMVHWPRFFFEIGIKMKPTPTPERVEENLEIIGDAWAQVFPEYIFDFRFMDTQIHRMYRKETRLAKLINIFTFIAIAISALGLYGLISFMANQKTKEIGVRKVLGASVPQILKLFLGEFVVLLLIAVVIAGPIAFKIMDTWLQDFAYSVDIGIWVFALAFMVSLLIAIGTVGYRSLLAAQANPVDSLKDE